MQTMRMHHESQNQVAQCRVPARTLVMFDFSDKTTSEYGNYSNFVNHETNMPYAKVDLEEYKFPYGYTKDVGEFRSFQQENILSKDECDFLIWLAESEEQWLEETLPFWQGRNLPLLTMLPQREYAVPETLGLCLDIVKRIQEFINKSFNVDSWPDQIGIVRWPADSYQMVHIDDVDGLERVAGCVVFLNDDFEGGEPFYPNYDKMVKPKTGMIYAHSSDKDHLHGVTQIKNKTRYTISTTWTTNKSKCPYLNLLGEPTELLLPPKVMN